MTFAGVNYLAIFTAAIVAWLAGAAWYMALGNVWMTALGTNPEKMQQMKKEPGAFLPFIYAFLSDVVMAWVLAGLIGHLGTGQVTIRNGIIAGAFCWLGFVLTTMLVNYSFGRRDWRLLLIDGGHWLLVLTVIGAIIGTFGV